MGSYFIILMLFLMLLFLSMSFLLVGLMVLVLGFGVVSELFDVFGEIEVEVLGLIFDFVVVVEVISEFVGDSDMSMIVSSNEMLKFKFVVKKVMLFKS